MVISFYLSNIVSITEKVKGKIVLEIKNYMRGRGGAFTIRTFEDLLYLVSVRGISGFSIVLWWGLGSARVLPSPSFM
jgi:hypothetical protein